MRKVSDDGSEGLDPLDILRAAVRVDGFGGGGAEWYDANRDRVIAVMRGEPCEFGLDGRRSAAGLVMRAEKDEAIRAEAERVHDELEMPE